MTRRSLPTEFRPLIRLAQEELDARAIGSPDHRQVQAARGFELDLAQGTVTFDTPDGPLTKSVQIAGTLAPDGEFMWAWGHPSVPEPLQAAAWKLKSYADAHQMLPLLDRKAHATPKRAADHAALTALFADAAGIFGGDYGSGQVWLAWS